MKLTQLSIKNILLVVLENKKVRSLLSCIFKMIFKFLKILQCTFLDKSPQKLDIFAINLQYILSLQKVGQDKTKETVVLK